MSSSLLAATPEDIASRDVSDELPAEPTPSATRVALQVLLIALTVALGLWALHRLQAVAFVLILAVFLAYLLAPLVDLAQRPVRAAKVERRLSRGLAIGIVYLVIAGLLGGGMAVLLPRATRQISQAASELPAYGVSLRKWEQRWIRYYERANLPAEVRESIDRSVVVAGDNATTYARGLLMDLIGMLTYLPWLVLVPVVTFFLLKDADMFRRTALKALPHRVQLRAHRLLEDMNTAFAAYIRAQFLACALVGIVCAVAFGSLGMPSPILLGVCAGVLEFIPLVGPLLLAAGTVTIAALQAPMLAVWVVSFLLVLRIVEDYVVYPRLIGRGLHLHPLAVVVAVLVGVELDGVAGLFVAIPVIALVSVASRHWFDWRDIDARSGELPPT